ncbi:MAG: response regulator [Deltaproteobacteria bacterium]|nr:response regulator [Deltaproteobacteria bacterium]
MSKHRACSKKELNKKLLAVGELASGAAHNFNNLINVILSRTDLLLKKMEDHPSVSDLEIIRRAATEAAQVVQRLHRTTQEKGYGKKEWVNVNELLYEVISMTKSRWQDEAQQRGISVRISLQLENVPKVYAWSAALKEVFMNIMLNAIDAVFVKGGVIMVQTQAYGQNLKIMILDSGEGMSKATVKQIFKPFFTTKGERGSGLGLSTSYEIIKKHKGDLEVQSMLGTGTTFVISLPLSKKVSLPPQKNPLIKKIMLVDDEADYRKATAELLSLEGYDVEQASDGHEALEKLKKRRFDLILSDISMPKLSGHDLVQKVKSEHKNTKVILISGFSEKLNHETMKALKVDGWLTKPCLFEDISEAIKKTCH